MTLERKGQVTLERRRRGVRECCAVVVVVVVVVVVMMMMTMRAQLLQAALVRLDRARSLVLFARFCG